MVCISLYEEIRLLLPYEKLQTEGDVNLVVDYFGPTECKLGCQVDVSTLG